MVAFLLTILGSCKKKENIPDKIGDLLVDEIMTEVGQGTTIPVERETIESQDPVMEEKKTTEGTDSTCQTSTAVEPISPVTEPAPPETEMMPSATELPDHIENDPVVTEITEPIDAASPDSQVPPGDNWETPDL